MKQIKPVYKQEGPQVKPLAATKSLKAEAVLNQPVRNQKIVANMTPATSNTSTTSHSRHSEGRSEHYHAKILGGRQSAARATDQLNPDSSVSENAKTQGRRFPGL
jgi:hypothetical protein